MPLKNLKNMGKIFKMRNILEKKKGDISVETLLTAFLAVVGIIFLAFLGVKLYNFFIDQDSRNEQVFIGSLKGKIEALENGEEGNFPLQGLEGRIILGWSKNQTAKDDGKPEKCFFDSCLCIVKQGKSVQDDGFCRKMDRDNVIVNSSISYKETNSGYTEGIYDIKAECIALQNQLMEIKATKREKEILVSTQYVFLPSDGDIEKQKVNLANLLKSCRKEIKTLKEPQAIPKDIKAK